MKKKIFAVLTAVFMVMVLIPTVAFAADEYTVRVHYEKADTTGWDVWNCDSSTAIAFVNGVAEFKASEGCTFIVRKSDWSDREDGDVRPFDGTMGGDRSIDFTKAVDGVVDVYVAVGSTENTYKDPAPVESAPTTTDTSTDTTDTSTDTTDTTDTSTDTTDSGNTTTADGNTSADANTDTGVEGVAAVLGVAAVAAGAMLVAKKRK